jgi:regulator of sigma E protease
MPAEVDTVDGKGNAFKAGLKKGDVITAIDGIATNNYIAVKREVMAHPKQQINVTVQRNQETITIPTQVSDSGNIGFAFKLPASFEEGATMGLYKLEQKKYGFFEAFPAGVLMALDKLNFYVQQFKLILNPKTGAYKGLGGFDSMRRIYSTELDWQQFWTITAFLSIVLAFMNLLPIPGLDGGYVVFTLIEMITGRKVNEKVMEVATTIGLVILLALMLYANGMDIFRVFKK